MAKRKNKPGKSDATSATVGYEAQLWQMADALRGNMEAAKYSQVAPVLLLLKFISDAIQRMARYAAAHTRHTNG